MLTLFLVKQNFNRCNITCVRCGAWSEILPLQKETGLNPGQLPATLTNIFYRLPMFPNQKMGQYLKYALTDTSHIFCNKLFIIIFVILHLMPHKFSNWDSIIK
jgi:hypothetical protein